LLHSDAIMRETRVGLYGLQLQRELGARLPIVVITAHGNIAMTVHAMKAGAADFLAKPVRDTDLLQAIEHALESAKRDSTQAAVNGLRCISA
jgi:FixJ family two-component response regulator